MSIGFPLDWRPNEILFDILRVCAVCVSVRDADGGGWSMIKRYEFHGIKVYYALAKRCSSSLYFSRKLFIIFKFLIIYCSQWRKQVEYFWIVILPSLRLSIFLPLFFILIDFCGYSLRNISQCQFHVRNNLFALILCYRSMNLLGYSDSIKHSVYGIR